MLKKSIMGRARKMVVEDIVDRIVADKMMCYPMDRHGDGLFDQATRLQVVRVVA
jgi:hypothetical protein